MLKSIEAVARNAIDTDLRILRYVKGPTPPIMTKGGCVLAQKLRLGVMELADDVGGTWMLGMCSKLSKRVCIL